MTHTTVSMLAGTMSMASATICRPNPTFMVRFKPNLAPNQPPTKFVTTPNAS